MTKNKNYPNIKHSIINKLQLLLLYFLLIKYLNNINLFYFIQYQWIYFFIIINKNTRRHWWFTIYYGCSRLMYTVYLRLELIGNYESNIENFKLGGVKVKRFKNSKVKDIVIPYSIKHQTKHSDIMPTQTKPVSTLSPLSKSPN